MRMREKHIGHVLGLYPVGLELLAQLASHTKRPHIDQNHPPLPAQERHRAPSESAMADRFAREALHQNIQCVHLNPWEFWRQ